MDVRTRGLAFCCAAAELTEEAGGVVCTTNLLSVVVVVIPPIPAPTSTPAAVLLGEDDAVPTEMGSGLAKNAPAAVATLALVGAGLGAGTMGGVMGSGTLRVSKSFAPAEDTTEGKLSIDTGRTFIAGLSAAGPPRLRLGNSCSIDRPGLTTRNRGDRGGGAAGAAANVASSSPSPSSPSPPPTPPLPGDDVRMSAGTADMTGEVGAECTAYATPGAANALPSPSCGGSSRAGERRAYMRRGRNGRRGT